jgi:hypothetical protein
MQVRIMGERICLNSASNFKPCVSLISQFENSTKAVEGEVANFQKRQSRWLQSSLSNGMTVSCLKTYDFSHRKLNNLYLSLDDRRFAPLAKEDQHTSPYRSLPDSPCSTLLRASLWRPHGTPARTRSTKRGNRTTWLDCYCPEVGYMLCIP